MVGLGQSQHSVLVLPDPRLHAGAHPALIQHKNPFFGGLKRTKQRKIREVKEPVSVALGLPKSRLAPPARGAIVSPALPQQERPVPPRTLSSPPTGALGAALGPGSPCLGTPQGVSCGRPARLNIPSPGSPCSAGQRVLGKSQQQKRGIVYTRLWTPLGERWAWPQASKHTRTGRSEPVDTARGRQSDPQIDSDHTPDTHTHTSTEAETVIFEY